MDAFVSVMVLPQPWIIVIKVLLVLSVQCSELLPLNYEAQNLHHSIPDRHPLLRRHPFIASYVSVAPQVTAAFDTADTGSDPNIWRERSS